MILSIIGEGVFPRELSRMVGCSRREIDATELGVPPVFTSRIRFVCGTLRLSSERRLRGTFY